MLIAVSAAFLAAVALAAVWLHRKPYAGHTYRIGVRNNSLYYIVASDGRISGLAVDAISEAARRAGIQLRWVNSPEGPDAALRSQKVDLWPLVAINPERRAYLHISDPWMALERCLVSRGPLRLAGRDARVAYGFGPISLERIPHYLPRARALQKSDEMAALQAVCSGEAAAALVWVQSLDSLLLRRPKGCETAEFQVTLMSDTRITLGTGSTFAAARVADRLRSEIGRLAAEGNLRSLFNKYLVYSNADSEEIYRLRDAEQRSEVLSYGAVGLAMAVAILLWQMRRVREARHAAERANAAKSEFLANMSHEIRTPLNGIVGMTELLARSRLESAQNEMVTVIQSSCESLVAVVNDILDFSKIEAGCMCLESIPADLSEIVHSVARLFAPRALSKGLDLQVSIHPGVPRHVRTDPLRIRQVLMNLLANALKFTEKGTVRVEVALAGDPVEPLAILFRVIDTGIGIDPHILDQLFTPFTQADSATTRKYGGTGLGLTISHRLVSLLGGSIGAESQPGAGSTFWFLIPVEPVEPAAFQPSEPTSTGVAPAARPLPTLPAEAHTCAGHILIVEDNPVNQIVALRAVRSLGYEAEMVPSGEAALEACARRHFDLILMDCQMPGMDGYQAAAEIRRREAAKPASCGPHRIPIVAMTANAIEGDREKCLSSGMDDYLAKPIRFLELSRTLERWVGPHGRSLAADESELQTGDSAEAKSSSSAHY